MYIILLCHSCRHSLVPPTGRLSVRYTDKTPFSKLQSLCTIDFGLDVPWLFWISCCLEVWNKCHAWFHKFIIGAPFWERLPLLQWFSCYSLHPGEVFVKRWFHSFWWHALFLWMRVFQLPDARILNRTVSLIKKLCPSIFLVHCLGSDCPSPKYCVPPWHQEILFVGYTSNKLTLYFCFSFCF